MADPFKDLYDSIAERKGERLKVDPYVGGNGRIDRAVDLILDGTYFPKGGVLMDVGGANGNLGYALRDHFSERVVVDISQESCDAALAKGNSVSCRNVDLEGLPGRDGWVDLIVSLDFIEHILDPEKFARECHRVLRPNGMVLINTPNIQYWRHLDSLVCKGVFPHTSGDPEVYHGGHTAFYNVQDLRRIFGMFEERVMHVNGLKADPPPPIWVNLMTSGYIGPTDPKVQLSYADLIFSCKKL